MTPTSDKLAAHKRAPWTRPAFLRLDSGNAQLSTRQTNTDGVYTAS